MKKSVTAKILISVSIIALTISFYIFVSQTHEQNNPSQMKSQFDGARKISILIVPGHEPNAGGANEFKKIKERDLNLQLSLLLKDDLLQNPEIEVVMARDQNGWNTDLKNYVTVGSSTILSWVADMKKKMMDKVDAGEMKLINPGMKHNSATSEAVLYLYGTNKWIEKNNIDLVLHIHFNNNPKINGKPNYSGYAIYVPEKQYNNATSSKIFSSYINEEISKIENKSDMPQEKSTIIEDQQLVAVGTYDTLKIPAVVVEYAYIYEPMMVNSSTRNNFIKIAASSTATAIKKFIKTL